MKITRLILLVIGITCMGMFNSCKDYDEDNYNALRHELQDQNSSLTQLVNDQIGLVKSQIDSLKAAIDTIKSCDCDTVTMSATIEGLGDAVSTLQTALSDANDRSDSLAQITASLDQDLENAQSRADSAYALAAKDSFKIVALTTITSGLNTAVLKAQGDATAAYKLAQKDSIEIVTLKNSVHVLDSVIVAWGPQLKQAVKEASEALALAKADSVRLDLLTDTLKNYATKKEVKEVLDSAQKLYNKSIAYTNYALDSVKSILLDSINAKYAALESAYKAGDKQLLDSINFKYAALESAYMKADSALMDSIADLRADIGNLYNKITDLDNKFKSTLNKMITSIVVQGTVNPVFGSFALPAGVRSNVLMAYFGFNENKLYFPTTRTANYVREEYALTDRDAELLNLQETVKPGGSCLLDGNAGKVYLTVNPNTVDFTGATFELVNSLDEPCPVQLGALKPSTDKLSFGWTKDAPKNAFYEAQATISEDKVVEAGLKIDDRLKDAMKDALHFRNGVDLTNVAQQLYNQFDGFLDAYGVKATWTDTRNDTVGAHSVYSKYEIAATAVHPLSYTFLYDKSFGKLNKVNSLIEKLADKLDDAGNLDLTDYIDISKLKFNLDSITSDFTVKVQLDTLYIHGSDVYTRVVVDENGNLQEIVTKLDDVDAVTAKILNERANVWSAQLREEFNKQMGDKMKDLTDKINKMTSDMDGKLQANVTEIINDVNKKINSNLGDAFSTMKSFLKKVERVFNRVKGIINNANAYLQVAMFYEAADGTFHTVSNTKSIPTVVTGTGAIELYPSSFTSELVAPAYQKFVAVTDVMKDGRSAQAGDAECVSVLQQTNNNNSFFNNVLEGGRYAVAFQPAASGYTYEIHYSAVDYSGKISARKFYVTVK